MTARTTQNNRRKNEQNGMPVTLIKSLTLKNFGLFQDQTISFQHGITLLTGPNGSGKSTILNGIILGLGGNPVKGKTTLSLGEFIGLDKKKPAKIKLVLRNPMLKENPKERLLPFPTGEVIIEREIHARKLLNGEIGYQSRWRINHKRSSLTEIQEVLKQLEYQNIILDPLNPLTFVKEHSIDLLVAMPNTEKFAVFAEILAGLKTTADNYMEAQEQVTALSSVLKRKQKELYAIKEKLHVLEELKKKYEYRVSLEERLTELEIEEQWSKYFQNIHEYKQVFMYIEKLRDDIKKYQKQITRLQVKQEELRQELLLAQEQETQLTTDLNHASQKALQISRRYQGLMDQQQMKQTQIRSINRRLEAHVEKLQRLGITLEQAKQILEKDEAQTHQKFLELETRRKAIDQQMLEIAEKIRKLKREVETRERLVNQLRRELEDLTETQRSLQQEITVRVENRQNSRYLERGKIRDTLKVHEFIQTQRIKDAWVVFKHVFIHPQYWKYMYAINWALRYKHFDIVTSSIETRNTLVDYRRMHDLEITIAYAPRHVQETEYKPINYAVLTHEERAIIVAPVYDMIYCRVPEVRNYILKELQSVVVKPTRNDLLERLQARLKRDILTQHDTLLEHYTRSYSRSVKLSAIHMVLSELPLQANTSRNDTLESQNKVMKKLELEARILNLQDEIMEFREQLLPLIEEQNTLVAMKTKVNRDLEQFKVQNKVMTSKETKKMISKVFSDYERDRNQLQKQQQALQDIESRVNALQRELEELRDHVNHIKESLQDSKLKQESLKQELENSHIQEVMYENQIKKVEQNIQNEQMKLQVKENILINMLVRLPLHPKYSSREHVRPLSQVLNEKQAIQAEISQIQATKHDKERYEQVKRELGELESQVNEVLEMLNDVQPTYQKRLQAWITAVKNFEEHLEQAANDLLHPYLHIHLRIKNIRDPRKTQMQITYITRLDVSDETHESEHVEKQSRRYRDFKMASGGEQVLIILALILSTYEVSNHFFPVRIIDEFGQRLDPLKKAIALEMVRKSVLQAKQRGDRLSPQIILASPIITNLELPSDVHQKFLFVVKLINGRIQVQTEESSA